MQQSYDFVGTPRLNLEEWAALLPSTYGGRGDHEVIDPNAFAGWMRRVSVYGVAAAAFKIQCGLAAVDHRSNTYRFERTRRAIRRADADRYCALFQVVGRSELTQNDQTIQLGVGDIGLVDGARPSTRLSDNGSQWLSIYLPRQSLFSHLEFRAAGLLAWTRRNGRGARPPSARSRRHRRRGNPSRAVRPPPATRPLRSRRRTICAV